MSMDMITTEMIIFEKQRFRFMLVISVYSTLCTLQIENDKYILISEFLTG